MKIIPQDSPVVYFIRRGPLIKIGFSTNMVDRKGSIPGELLGFLPGGRVEESQYHKRFAALRDHGEWFRDEGSLSEFVVTLPPVDGIPGRVTPFDLLPPVLQRVYEAASMLRRTEADLEAVICRLSVEGHSLRSIAEAAGTDRMTVSRMLKRNGVE